MQINFDFFEDSVNTNQISEPTAAIEPCVPLLLDRRKIWGEGGYLATLEDNETSIQTTAQDCQNATIERLEAALRMRPVIEGGEWVEDGSFYAYELVEPVIGQRQFGKRGSLLRDATLYMLQNSACKVLEELFTDTGSWSPRWAYWLFCYRLRKADDCEDPYELLKLFTQAMSVFDPLDASRKGETLRTLEKRNRMRQKRAESRLGTASDAESQEQFDQENVLKTA
jgi:hypothetical protein